MVNYQNGKIYKIESLIGGCIYVGSTCQKLSMRMAQHRQKYRQQKQYYTSYEVLKYSDAKILLILNHTCNSKEELEAKEAEYIKQLDCVNKYIPGRTIKQWTEDNKETITKYQKKWRSENKEYAKEYNKKYRETNEDKIKLRKQLYYQKNKEKNKEIFKLRGKKYREKNKEKINLKAKEKYTCDCGSTIRKSDKTRHNKTKKHLKFIEQQ